MKIGIFGYTIIISIRKGGWHLTRDRKTAIKQTQTTEAAK